MSRWMQGVSNGTCLGGPFPNLALLNCRGIRMGQVYHCSSVGRPVSEDSVLVEELHAAGAALC